MKRNCRGCGIEFEPTKEHRFYHSKDCQRNSHNLYNRDQMKKRRGSRSGPLNLGGLMDMIDKEGPMQIRRNGKVYIFSTISRGRVQVPA